MDTKEEAKVPHVPPDVPLMMLVSKPVCCSKKRCVWITSAEPKPLFPCDFGVCEKHIHEECYEKYIKNKDPVSPLVTVLDFDGEERFYCKKTCYTQGKKHWEGICSGKKKLGWHEDGKQGPKDPKTSESILLDWFTTEGNYKSFCQNTTGTTKIAVAQQLARKINGSGVRQSRTYKDVLNKIRNIELCFRTAFEFANRETGQGLKETDEKMFEDACRKKCQYYFDLVDIMGDMASTMPKATNELLAKASEDGVLSCGDSSDGEDILDVATNLEESTLKTPLLGKRKTAGSNTAKGSSAKPTKSKQPGKQCVTVLKDPEMQGIMEMMQKGKELDDRSANETERHHRFLEKASLFAHKKEEMEYKLKLVENYHALLEKGKDHSYIASIFPEMVVVFPRKERVKYQKKALKTATEKNKYTKKHLDDDDPEEEEEESSGLEEEDEDNEESEEQEPPEPKEEEAVTIPLKINECRGTTKTVPVKRGRTKKTQPVAAAPTRKSKCKVLAKKAVDLLASSSSDEDIYS